MFATCPIGGYVSFESLALGQTHLHLFLFWPGYVNFLLRQEPSEPIRLAGAFALQLQGRFAL